MQAAAAAGPQARGDAVPVHPPPPSPVIPMSPCPCAREDATARQLCGLPWISAAGEVKYLQRSPPPLLSQQTTFVLPPAPLFWGLMSHLDYQLVPIVTALSITTGTPFSQRLIRAGKSNRGRHCCHLQWSCMDPPGPLTPIEPPAAVLWVQSTLRAEHSCLLPLSLSTY